MPASILVIEDNANISRFLLTTLEIEGFQVRATATLQAGLDAARREPPDLVLLDLSLPDGSGWEFMEAMRRQPDPKALRIVILTASADHGMADRGLAAGAIDFLTKPIAARELVARIHQALATQPRTSGANE